MGQPPAATVGNGKLIEARRAEPQVSGKQRFAGPPAGLAITLLAARIFGREGRRGRICRAIGFIRNLERIGMLPSSHGCPAKSRK